jgi:hypothetical protein
MKKTEKYQLTCFALTAFSTAMLLVTKDPVYFTNASVFAAAVFIIGALDK